MIRVSTLLNDIFTEANFSFSFVTISMNLDVNYITHATREGKIMETTFDLAKRVSRVQISIEQRIATKNETEDSPTILSRFSSLRGKSLVILHKRYFKYVVHFSRGIYLCILE